jgi:hypothetical protein
MYSAEHLLELTLGKSQEASPLVVLYSPHAGPRLHYVCRFVFGSVLKCRFSIVQNINEFKNVEGFRINYSAVAINNCYQLIPYGLLGENSLRTEKPETVLRDKQVYLFETNQKGTLPFDVLSAVFYCISRYEEWQPYERDRHGRFEARASLFYQYNAHLKPVADQWIHALRLSLEKFYTGLTFSAPAFRFISTIDLDNLYAYSYKGFLRTIGGCLKDIASFDFLNLKERLLVVLGGKKDPFDIYEEISAFCLQHQIPLFYFFLFSNASANDRTVSPANTGAFKKVIDTVKRHEAFIGLHPSYNAAYETALFEKEIAAFSSTSGEKIILSRQHFLRFDIRTTPQLLMRQGIIADFTMGFASEPGFRAGTAYPFNYYDFNAEQEADLLFIPFCAMDGAYTIYSQQNTEKSLGSLMELAGEIKKTGGCFATVFHERTFYDRLYKGFGPLYKNLHIHLKELSAN